MSFFSKKNFESKAGVASQPAAATKPDPSEPISAPSSEAIPMPAPAPEASPAPVEEPAATGLSPEFYGSYGEAAESVPMATPDAVPSPENTADAAATAGGIDFSVLDFDIPDMTLPDTEHADAPEKSEEEMSFSPMPDLSGGAAEDDDLVLPDLPPVSPTASFETKKSMGYETTVKLKDARSAYGNEKPINEPIKSDPIPASVPKRRDYTVVASGTAHVNGDLPKLKEGEMYVALTPKELRRLKSRKFRGLGVLATLCLAIIAAFCIWSYANSFVDPIIGVWKGDVNSAYIPIAQIQDMDEKSLQSTWEFSGSGSLYLNIVVNDTPVSLSGTYEQKKDSAGEPYLSMTLTNPMDSTDYTLEMYYTVTGKVLEFNDMEGMGMTIDLTKE